MPQLTPAENANLVQDDGRWRGDTGNPVYPNETIALDKSAFTGTWTNGFIPSGVALAQLTATKLYVPYGGNASEVQSLIATGASAGTFTLTFDGETTAAIAWNANAAAVQSALEALSSVNPGDITAAGGPLPGTAVTLTFGGQYGGTNVPAITGNSGSLTGGTATITTPTAGGSASSDGSQTFAGLLYAPVAYGLGNAAGDDLLGALFVGGTVFQEFLPVQVAGPGFVDADAVADARHIRFIPKPV
jgi:hypothetical protein